MYSTIIFIFSTGYDKYLWAKSFRTEFLQILEPCGYLCWWSRTFCSAFALCKVLAQGVPQLWMLTENLTKVVFIIGVNWFKLFVVLLSSFSSCVDLWLRMVLVHYFPFACIILPSIFKIILLFTDIGILSVPWPLTIHCCCHKTRKPLVVQVYFMLLSFSVFLKKLP